MFSHRTVALLRWDLHFISVRLSNRLKRRNSAIRNRAAKAGRPLFLNLGSGPRGLDSIHWINVDGFADRHVHHVMDFCRGLPFVDAAFDGIFCEHVMEHFDLDQGAKIFAECLRVLRPGGTVRIIVPDGSIILRAYFDDPATLIARRRPATGRVMEAVNDHFRQRYEHQCIYDFDLIREVLGSVGFIDVRHESFRIGHGPPQLLIDDQKYEWESLYCEATKPQRDS
jgi:predicted SAM-dependent methyltransferase